MQELLAAHRNPARPYRKAHLRSPETIIPHEGTILKVSFMKTIQVELPDRLAEPLHGMEARFVLPSILATAPRRLAWVSPGCSIVRLTEPLKVVGADVDMHIFDLGVEV